MSTTTCFHGEIRKISTVLAATSALSGTTVFTVCMWTDRPEHTQRDVSSGSALFATHPAVFRYNIRY